MITNPPSILTRSGHAVTTTGRHALQVESPGSGLSALGIVRDRYGHYLL